MRKRAHAAAVSLLSLSIYLLLSGASCFAETSGEKEFVKIGVIAPLTGAMSDVGSDIANVLPLLQEELNHSSNKYEYQFIVDDGKCGAGNAPATIVNKYIAVDKIKFLLAACSGEALQAGPIAERAGVLAFVVYGIHQDIKHLGEYIFRSYLDVEQAIQHFAKYIEAKKTPIAVLTEEVAFAMGVKDLLEKNLGARLVLSESFAANATDFRTLLLKAKNSGAQGVFLNAMDNRTLANMVNQASDLRLGLQLYSHGMPEVAGFREATGERSNGMLFLGAPVVTTSSESYLQILSQFKDKFSRGPNFEIALMSTFDAVKSMVDGIEAVGADPARVKDYLKTYSSAGATGKIEFDENGDIKNFHFVLKRVENDGRTTVVDDWSK